MVALLLLSVSLASITACGDTRDREPATTNEPRLSFWRVSARGADGGPAAHILAAVPVHDTTRLRFDPVIEAAFEQASRLVLPNDAALEPQGSIVGWKAHLGEGDALARWISPELHAAFTEAIGRAGFPAGTAEVTAPWFAAGVVIGADFRRTGFVRADEIVTTFAHRAEQRVPPAAVEPLEPSAATYDRYAVLAREVQVELLQIAVERSADADRVLADTQAAWQRGDVAALEALLSTGTASTPARRTTVESTAGVEAARLAAALARALGQTKERGDSFWVVPAEAVVGEHGLLARLEAGGLAVEQRTSKTDGGTLAPPSPLEVPPLPASDAPDPSRRRALVVGIDGATLRVIAPLLERGRLPALASLAAEGASGPLRSHQPIHSPRIWGSIATGKTPEHHGIEGFTFRDDDGRQQLYLSRHRTAHAVWNIFSQAELTVGVVNWWNTWPPEIVRGVMVSDHAVPTRLDDLEVIAEETPVDVVQGSSVYPPEWSDRIASALDLRGAITPIDDPFLGVVGIPPFMERERLSKRYEDDATITRIALEVDRTEAPDLLMVFLPGIDRVSHHLWGALEPAELYGPNLRLTESQRATTRRAIERYYEYTDALIGLLLARFGENDLVLVLSDHGFEGGEHLARLTGVHDGEAALDGVLFARGPGIAAGSSTLGTSVNDITPTVLAWRGLPLARDFDGAVAGFLTPPVDQPERVATYDVGRIERLEAKASGSEEEILERLRALGYIE